MASPSKTSVAEANKQLSEMFAQMQVRTAFRSLLFFSHAGNHTRTKGREERVLEGSLSLSLSLLCRSSRHGITQAHPFVVE